MPDDPSPSISAVTPADPPKVSETAKRAARRTRKGKKRQGGNNRGKLALESRIEMVVRLIDSFEEGPYIQRAVAKAFGCTERTVREDITRVEAERRMETEPDAYEERLRYKRSLLTQVRVCLREGNKSEARRFFDMLIRIGGHYAPDAVKLFEMNYGDLKRMSDTDLDRMEEELWRTYGPPTGKGRPALPPPAESAPDPSIPAGGRGTLPPLDPAGSVATVTAEAETAAPARVEPAAPLSQEGRSDGTSEDGSDDE